MDHDPKAYLFDIQQACEEIRKFTRDMSVEEYIEDTLVKAAVERKFLVIGEVLVRLRREFPELVNQINDHVKIIHFRNILVHGYDIIDDETVWSAIHGSMPTLERDVIQLLRIS